MLNQFTYGSPVLKAILNRNHHSGRLVGHVDRGVIHILLDVGMKISKASKGSEWSYAVIQDDNYLEYLSNYSSLLGQLNQIPIQLSQPSRGVKDEDHTSLRGALIVVCANLRLPFIADDCWLGVENILLAASALGYSSDLCGSLLNALNSHSIKSQLFIPDELTVLSAISISGPDSSILPNKVSEPKIWKWM